MPSNLEPPNENTPDNKTSPDSPKNTNLQTDEQKQPFSDDMLKAVANVEKEFAHEDEPFSSTATSSNSQNNNGIQPADEAISPKQATKESKKKLTLLLIVVLALVIFGSGGTALALWFNHPDKVASDAFTNIVNAKTMVNEGTYSYRDTDNKTSLVLRFKTQSDIPNYAGQLDLDAKLAYGDNFNSSLKGSAMMSESGTIYFRLQNVVETFNKALETDEAKDYISDSKQKDAIIALAKKIDNKWVQLDETDLGEFYNKQFAKQRECYKKAFSAFYENESQRKQVIDAYNKNRFFLVESNGKSMTVNNQDSLGYKVSTNVEAGEKFDEELDKSDIGKAIQKCLQSDTGQPSLDEGMSDEDIAEAQKEADKTKLTVWISRWSHEITKLELSYKEEAQTTNFNATFRPNISLKLKDPQQFIEFKEIRKELETIYGGYTQDYSDDEEISAYTQADIIVSSITSYKANNRGQSPTVKNVANFAPYVDATNTTNPLRLADGSLILFVDSVSVNIKDKQKQFIVWPNAICNGANVVKDTLSSSGQEVVVTTLLSSGKKFCY